MELFAARMVRSIIDQIGYTKNTENQCFLRNKKVDSGPLELKGTPLPQAESYCQIITFSRVYVEYTPNGML